MFLSLHNTQFDIWHPNPPCSNPWRWKMLFLWCLNCFCCCWEEEEVCGFSLLLFSMGTFRFCIHIPAFLSGWKVYAFPSSPVRNLRFATSGPFCVLVRQVQPIQSRTVWISPEFSNGTSTFFLVVQLENWTPTPCRFCHTQCKNWFPICLNHCLLVAGWKRYATPSLLTFLFLWNDLNHFAAHQGKHCASVVKGEEHVRLVWAEINPGL